jgi:hypothetical protein
MNSKTAKLISQIKTFNRNFESKKHRLIAFDNVFKSKYLFLTHFSTNKELESSPYREIIINYFVNAEKVYPGSSCLLSQLIVNKFFKFEENKVKSIDKTKKNLEKYYLQHIESDIVDNFINIIDFSGPDAILNCNVTKNKEFQVEKTSFPSFEINIHEEFQKVFFKNQESSTKNYLVCLYDGYVERESELYSLIEKSKSNNKCPILLVCRGISDYAVSSLKQILLKSNIFLYPYICKFDNTDPFIFSDLESILDIQSYNIESGDNLHKKISENSRFRKLRTFSNKIQVLSFSDKLKKEIVKQIQIADDDLKTYLYKRKNRCSPNNVSIMIPSTKTNLLHIYKSMIRSYNCIAVSGLYESNGKIYSKIEYVNCNKLANRFYNTVNNIGYTIKLGDNK